MRLLVCGNRDWTEASEIARHLALIFHGHRDRLVIHGNCGDLLAKPPRGADKLAGWLAAGLGAACEVYPVDPAIDGPWPGAGPRRNLRMRDASKPDQGIAFGRLWKRHMGMWKRTGTGGMVSLMLDVRLPVRWIQAPFAGYVDLLEMPRPS